jgi:shikimate kinase
VTRHLYLVGYRGTGKSTVGRLVAAELGRPFVDLDERIEAAARTSIAGIFASEGEAGFRDREAEALATIEGPPSVIATGGGIILREENRRLLKATGFVVWLQASAEAIWDRVQADTLTAARRPNLTVAGGLPEIVELLGVRERYYKEVADARVPTDGRSPEAVAAAILTLLRSIPSD